jgi:5-formyltetrahydrofolate cyclo-ligase
MSDLLIEKARLRASVRARVEALSAEARAGQARRLILRTRDFAPWQSARTVLLFAPLGDEADVWPLAAEALTAGKAVALPAYDEGTGSYVARRIRDVVTDVTVGRFGVREPRATCPAVTFAALDLLLVPGVAFDCVGNRLGRGKGFYDRLLALIPDAVSCGVGFDEQVVPAVPVEPHDVKLHYVLTPSRRLTGRAASA